LPDFSRKESSKAYYLIIKSLSFAHQKPIICQSKDRLLPKNCNFPHFVKRFLCFSAVHFFQIAKCRCRINLPTIAFVPLKDFVIIPPYSPISNNGMKMKSQGLWKRNFNGMILFLEKSCIFAKS
jgi:hypothetical protein